MNGRIEVKTRMGVSVKDRPKSFVAYLNEDKSFVQNDFLPKLLEILDAAFYFCDSIENNWDEINVLLHEIQAVFIVASSKMLDSDIAKKILAESEVIGTPVVPVLIQPIDGKTQKEMFGRTQYIRWYNKDDTEISYIEKISSVLNAWVKDTQGREEIRSAFRKRVFLSYRKKNRDKARELIRIIHNPDKNYDVAIWYDEFLTAGEKYDAEIAENLDACDFFVLVVTPDIFEKDELGQPNFVIREELPRAKELNKRIIAVEMTDVTDDQINSLGLSGVLSKNEAISIFNSLFDDETCNNDNDPLKLYQIGLAYINGVNVETDMIKGANLIKIAADNDYLDAVLKMEELYCHGIGFSSDKENELFWKNKEIDLLTTKCLNNASDTWMLDYNNLMSRMKHIIQDCLDDKLYDKTIEFSETANSTCVLLLKGYKKICSVSTLESDESRDDLNTAHKGVSSNLEYEYFAIENNRNLAVFLSMQATALRELGEYKNAKDLWNKCIEILASELDKVSEIISDIPIPLWIQEKNDLLDDTIVAYQSLERCNNLDNKSHLNDQIRDIIKVLRNEKTYVIDSGHSMNRDLLSTAVDHGNKSSEFAQNMDFINAANEIEKAFPILEKRFNETDNWEDYLDMAMAYDQYARYIIDDYTIHKENESNHAMTEKAESLLDISMSKLEELLKYNPDSTEIRERLFIAFSCFGMVQYILTRYCKSFVYLKRSIKLLEESPSIYDVQRTVLDNTNTYINKILWKTWLLRLDEIMESDGIHYDQYVKEMDAFSKKLEESRLLDNGNNYGSPRYCSFVLSDKRITDRTGTQRAVLTPHQRTLNLMKMYGESGKTCLDKIENESKEKYTALNKDVLRFLRECVIGMEYNVRLKDVGAELLLNEGIKAYYHSLYLYEILDSEYNTYYVLITPLENTEIKIREFEMLGDIENPNCYDSELRFHVDIDMLKWLISSLIKQYFNKMVKMDQLETITPIWILDQTSEAPIPTQHQTHELDDSNVNTRFIFVVRSHE